MQFSDERHTIDELLELYSSGRLAEPQLTHVEEHVLLCEHCQHRLSFEDDFREAMRAAAVNFDQQSRAANRFPRVAKPFVKPVWAYALAACLIAFVAVRWVSQYRPSTSPAAAMLGTTRGAVNSASAVPAREPIVLTLDLTDLPPLPAYKLEVVDETGRTVFQSTAVPENNRLRFDLSRGLPEGAYFVRVDSFANELLREYALAVRGNHRSADWERKQGQPVTKH